MDPNPYESPEIEDKPSAEQTGWEWIANPFHPRTLLCAVGGVFAWLLYLVVLMFANGRNR